MRQANLLILNTIVSYLSLAIKIIAGLLTIRFLLAEMGAENYGIYSTLAASSALLSVVQSGVADGARRHMSIEVGTGDTVALAGVFNSTLVLLACSAIGILVLGFSATDFVLSVIEVSPDRLPACRFAYYCSVLSLASISAAIPWQAFLSSRQQISFLSAISTAQALLTLLGVGLLPIVPGDPIAVYSALVLAVYALTSTAVCVYCMYGNPPSRPSWSAVDGRKMLSIVKFGGWIVFESVAIALREKGSLVLLTSSFGPVTTAAYDIALRLGNQFTSLAMTVANAVAPALTNAEGRGDTRFAIRLGDVLSRYSAHITCAFLVPFLLETSVILEWVIGASTSEMVVFSRIVMVSRFVGVLSWGDGIVAKSRNRIALLSLGLTLPFFLAFGFCVFAYRLGNSQKILLPVAMLFVTALGSFWFRPWHVRRQSGLAWRTFFDDVILNVLKSNLPAILVAVALHFCFPTGVFRLIVVVFGYSFTAAVFVWKFGISGMERDRFSDLIRIGMRRMSFLFDKVC
ncbi:hypothetical protein NHH03_16975 [Stieleria sp. TO1_6]|uniref:lipopolysaccharide biosynthesis protein n=1 Tax=Stieleria tagensis TaxID=2956795 RepID=UPI00209A6E4B|nr:hypothetical protein [Stieleria tagensis]MCO8123444.1 hypothetical protein [Stieleria tagensis]